MNPTRSRNSFGGGGRRASGNSSAGRKSFHGGGKRFGGGNRNRRGGGGRKMPSFNPAQFINTNPVEMKEQVYTPVHTFNDFGLDDRLTKTIAKMGIVTPSPIQDQIIPKILEGRDVIGLAETGTGKTAAFLIPLIEETLKDNDKRTLILAPTRELAIQINDELRQLVGNERVFSTVCVGGINIRPQIKALRRTNHFVIGTPGRVLDLINRRNFLPQDINTVVLDEADRMLDMGFIADIKSILSETPKDRTTLLFSATMGDKTGEIVNDFLRDPVSISVKKKDVTNSIRQDVVRFDSEGKFRTLTELLADPQFERVIIFGAMKHTVEKLSNDLSHAGLESTSIHGNKSHSQRQRALKKFKAGETQVLVATDVAARGIHVDDVSHVINYDLPQTFDDYVHRIGRTGRGSKRGEALTFVPTKK